MKRRGLRDAARAIGSSIVRVQSLSCTKIQSDRSCYGCFEGTFFHGSRKLQCEAIDKLCRNDGATVRIMIALIVALTAIACLCGFLISVEANKSKQPMNKEQRKLHNQRMKVLAMVAGGALVLATVFLLVATTTWNLLGDLCISLTTCLPMHCMKIQIFRTAGTNTALRERRATI